jgi:hypothetical protein
MSTIQLRLETRKKLAVAARTLRQPPQPMVFVTTAPQAKRSPKMETTGQAELRRERTEQITRRAPEVVITSRWVHTASSFDGQQAVVLRLPWMQRLRNWLRSE